MQTQTPSSLPTWGAGLFDAIRLCGLLNVTAFLLTALGTYLTYKGRKDIRAARAISATARQNIMTQVAANEFGECRHHAEMLWVHMGNRSWPISEYISAALSTKLAMAKAFERELQGINRDALDVSVRTALQLRDYLSTTNDPEPEKIQKG